MSPTQGKTVTFNNIEDVYSEIIRLGEKAKEKGFKIGESIYKGAFFFVDQKLIVTREMQNRIKEYKYCKSFNCSYSQSLDITPAKIVDDFIIISEEFENAQIKDREDKKQDAKFSN